MNEKPQAEFVSTLDGHTSENGRASMVDQAIEGASPELAEQIRKAREDSCGQAAERARKEGRIKP